MLAERRRLTKQFLEAAHRRDIAALLQVLDPAVTLTSDRAAAELPMGPGRELAGSEQVAAYFAKQGAGAAHMALINGEVGIIVAPQHRLLLILQPQFENGRIASLAATAAPEALSALDIALVP